MKKILLAAAVALCFSGNSLAQEKPGGDAASNSAFGAMKVQTIVGGAVGVGLVGAFMANTRGDTKTAPGGGPDFCGAGEVLVDGECVPEPDPDPVCAGEDPLVDGVCTGATTTVTVTATGTGTATGTATVTIPVTFTYLPTI